MKRRILSMLLVLMMLFTIMPTAALAEETADGVTYSYADGVLTVSGTGTCTNEWRNDLPWDTWTSVTDLIINEDITGIGQAAFGYLPKLKNITIPASVTEIGPYAFQSCSGLESISWPSNVTRIEEGVLASCSSLKSITIPETVTYIGAGAFSGCTSLNELTIPASVTYIGDSPCDRCTSLKTINVAEGNSAFSSVDGTLLRNYDGFKVLYQCPAGYEEAEYTVPEEVAEINNSAFAGCNTIETINIGAGVYNIRQWAFRDCEKLSKITVAEGNSYFKVQNGALFQLKWSEVNEGVFKPTNELEYLLKCVTNYDGVFEIPDGVIEISDCAFENCSKLTGVTIPSSLDIIGQMAFRNCDGLTDITIPGNVSGIWNYAFEGCSILKKVVIQDGVTLLGSAAFIDCAKLEDITLPSTITTLYSGLFHGCSSLKSVIIPDGVEIIDGGVFTNCTSLKNVIIPASVKMIGLYAFDYGDSGRQLDNVYFGGSSEQWKALVGDYDVLNNFAKIVHYNYVAGQEHTVTNGVCSCGAYSADHTHVYGDDGLCKYCGEQKPDTHEHDFLHGTVGTDDNGTYLTCAVKDCTARSYARVETGKCGDNVTYTWTKFDVPGFDTLVISGKGDMWDWGEVSPRWRGQLTTVIVEEGITRVGDRAIAAEWHSGNLLTTVQLPSTLKSIGAYAFSYNENLKSIKLPDGLETIEVGAFQACNSLTSVTIPASVKSIQFAAFSASPSDKLSKAYSLTQYNVAVDNAYYKSVDGALYSKGGSTLVNYPAARTNTKITVPDGTAKLSDWAFRGNANVETIVLPASITDIQMGAFYRCDSLKTILFNGTEAQWKEACKDTENIKAEVVCLGDESGKTVSDKKTDPTVTVSGYGDAIDTVNTVTITEADDDTAMNIIAGSNIVLISGDGVKSYDITLKNSDGEVHELDGYVQVKLKVPENYDGSKCVVYHQEENGTLTPMDAVFDGGYLVFITDSFSKYIIHQPHEHVFDTSATVPATCTDPGYTEETCTVEGCGYVRKTEIPATGHNAPLTGAKDATCTEDGSTGERICTKCKAILQIAQVIEAKGHDYVNGKCTVCGATNPDYNPPRPVHIHRYTETVTEPTCTEKGYTTYTCICGRSYVDNYVDALGHTEVVDPAVAATCEKTGLTEGKHCSVCNEVLVAQKETPKTEHKFENGKCSVCGAADPDYVAPVVNPFKDVKEGDAFYDEILWAADKGIINGDGTGNYNPNDGITRAQIVMILWNAAGNKEASKPSGFADVKEDAWYAKAVAWAVENGITNGTDLGFEPDRVCTRAEIVTFLHRANNKPAPAAAASFTDLTQDWYKDAVAWAVENGITKGVGDNRFAPNDTCTRGQAAAFMYRLAQLAK